MFCKSPSTNVFYELVIDIVSFSNFELSFLIQHLPFEMKMFPIQKHYSLLITSISQNDNVRMMPNILVIYANLVTFCQYSIFYVQLLCQLMFFNYYFPPIFHMGKENI